MTHWLAALLIAGLLWYLRDGRRVLLCVALFVAPLLQYGLVLFGVAVHRRRYSAYPPPPPTLGSPERDSFLNRVRNWLQWRVVALVLPAGCFLAGCILSYAVTLRYQWQAGGWGSSSYLAEYYYQGKFDAPAIFEFSINGIWLLLTYHLPEVVTIAALTAGAIFLVVSLLRKFQGEFSGNAIAVLLALCLAISVAVALLRLYPLGDVRQGIYLGPVVFLAVGVAFQGAAGGLAGLMRRGWLAPALVGVVAMAIALVGVDNLRQNSPYETSYDAQAVFAFLEENVEEGDLVYVTGYSAPSVQFYQAEKPSNYYYGYYGRGNCKRVFDPCLRALADLIVSLPNVPNRIYVTHQSEATWPTISGWVGTTTSGEAGILELLGERVSVEGVITEGVFNISLITYAKESMELAAHSTYAALVSGEPAIRSDFDVYLSENTLTYVKEPCVPADTEAQFFLHLHSVEVNALPGLRQQHGFDNLDFDFDDHGAVFDGRCTAVKALPDYAITRIITGQYVLNAGQYVLVGGGFNRLWEGEIRPVE